MSIDWDAVITSAEKTAAERAAQRAAIADRRWRAMCAGTTVAGIRVHTDDVAQTRILGAALEAIREPNYSLQWKLEDGTFTPIDATGVLALATAIRAHVQSCYNREAELLADFEAGLSIDLEAGWPS